MVSTLEQMQVPNGTGPLSLFSVKKMEKFGEETVQNSNFKFTSDLLTPQHFLREKKIVEVLHRNHLSHRLTA